MGELRCQAVPGRAVFSGGGAGKGVYSELLVCVGEDVWRSGGDGQPGLPPADVFGRWQLRGRSGFALDVRLPPPFLAEERGVGQVRGRIFCERDFCCAARICFRDWPLNG